MYHNYKAIIFDMDGTLIDSMWVWARVDEKFFAQHHMPFPKTLQQEIEGLSMYETAEYFLSHFPLSYSESELIAIWNDMAAYEYHHEVPYKPGALEFLKEVKSLGLKTGIATSNSRELVEEADSHLQFSKYIDYIVTSNEVPNGKPAPDIYLKIADKLKVHPKDCLVFEDIPGGITAATRAGMDTCAIEDDFSRHLQQEKKKMATYFITSYLELLHK